MTVSPPPTYSELQRRIMSRLGRRKPSTSSAAAQGPRDVTVTSPAAAQGARDVTVTSSAASGAESATDTVASPASLPPRP